MRVVDLNIRIIMLPVVAIPTLLILCFFVVTQGYKQVSTQIKDIRKIEKGEEALREKLSVLGKVRANVLEKTNIALIALPEKNPATMTVSQVKRALEKVPLSIKKVAIREGLGGGIEGVNNSVFKVEASGAGEDVDTQAAIEYIKLLARSIPMISINKVSVSKEGNSISLSIEGFIYNSLLPDKLPPLTQPVRELSDLEEVLIEEISALSQPEFSVLEPNDPTDDRRSPFLKLD